MTDRTDSGSGCWKDCQSCPCSKACSFQEARCQGSSEGAVYITSVGRVANADIFTQKSAPKSVGKGDVKKVSYAIDPEDRTCSKLDQQTARAPPRDRSKPTRPVRSARKST